MIPLGSILAVVGAIVSASGAYFLLKFKVDKSQADIKGLSQREAANTKHAQRMFILRIASDIDMAAEGNNEVHRLTELLRKEVEGT